VKHGEDPVPSPGNENDDFSRLLVHSGDESGESPSDEIAHLECAYQENAEPSGELWRVGGDVEEKTWEESQGDEEDIKDIHCLRPKLRKEYEEGSFASFTGRQEERTVVDRIGIAQQSLLGLLAILFQMVTNELQTRHKKDGNETGEDHATSDGKVGDTASLGTRSLVSKAKFHS